MSLIKNYYHEEINRNYDENEYFEWLMSEESEIPKEDKDEQRLHNTESE